MEPTQQSSPKNVGSILLDPLPICNHIFPKGRHCRQPVARPGGLFCTGHARQHSALALAGGPVPNPLEELAEELGAAAEVEDVRKFISKVIRLACHNRINMSRATALTFMANSLLNTIRLANHEARLDARDNPETIQLDFSSMYKKPETTSAPSSDSQGQVPDDQACSRNA